MVDIHLALGFACPEHFAKSQHRADAEPKAHVASIDKLDANGRHSGVAKSSEATSAAATNGDASKSS